MSLPFELRKHIARNKSEVKKTNLAYRILQAMNPVSWAGLASGAAVKAIVKKTYPSATNKIAKLQKQRSKYQAELMTIEQKITAAHGKKQKGYIKEAQTLAQKIKACNVALIELGVR